MNNTKSTEKNLIQRIGSHIGRNWKKYATIGACSYMLSTCEPGPKNNIVVDYGQEIDSAYVVNKDQIAKPEEEKYLSEFVNPNDEYGIDYYANTKKGLTPISRTNLFYSTTDGYTWNQSTKGYPKTEKYRQTYGATGFRTAVMINDTLYVFRMNAVDIGFDGLGTTPLYQK